MGTTTPTTPTANPTFGTVWQFVKADLKNQVPASALPVVQAIDLEQYRALEGVGRMVYLQGLLEQAQVSLEGDGAVTDLADALDRILKSLGVNPDATVPVGPAAQNISASVTVTQTTSGAPAAGPETDDDLLLMQPDTDESASGLNAGAYPTVDAAVPKFVGQADMASVMLGFDILGFFGKEKFFQDMRLPVGHPLHAKLAAFNDAVEMGTLLNPQKRMRVLTWVTDTMDADELDQLMELLATLSKVTTARALIGDSLQSDLNDLPADIANVPALLALYGERLTERSVTSRAPDDVVAVVEAVHAAVALFKDADLHEYMGRSVAIIAKTKGADEAALEVIRTLSPDAAGVTAQIRWALALESFYNAYSAFIQKPTKKNLGILTQRAGYLKMAYMAVATKKEVRPDEKPFRRVQDAPVTTVPAHGVFKQLRVDFAVRWQLS